MELIGSLSNKKSIGAGAIKDTAAIITPEFTLSYKLLGVKILATVHSLNVLGVKNGTRVAILSENNPDYVILILALWKLGAIPVPLNIRLLPEEVKDIVLFAECGFLFLSKPYPAINNIPGVIIKEFSFKSNSDESTISINNSPLFTDKFKMSSTALIIFTSGSTGKPKGVVFTFNNLFHSAFNGNKLFNHRNGDSWLASLPFYHIGGFSVISRNFFYGTTLIIPSSLSIEELVYAIINLKPAFASLVTTQLQRIMEAGCKPNAELRQILLGGGFLENSLVREAINNGWNVSKSYGASETSSFVTYLTAEEFLIKPDSAGKAIPPNQILILDEKRSPLPCNSVGEVAVKAQSVACGYLNNEEESKKKFIGNIYYSGDYGYVDKDGYLFIEARREDLIVSGGENIVPLEVEKEILKFPGVKEVYVFGIEDKEWGHIVAAAIASADVITTDELKKFLSSRLPAFKLPKKIFQLEELPKTELGKIQKGKIWEILKIEKFPRRGGYAKRLKDSPEGVAKPKD